MSEIRRVPEIKRSDVRALLRAIGPWTVPSADVYERYCAMMVEQDRPAVSQVALGAALRRCGQRAKVKSVDRRNIRCWELRESRMADAPEVEDMPA